MGTLRHGAFENDDVADWLEKLLARQEISLLYEAFNNVIGEDATDHLEIKECCTAVAAAEILSQLVGRPTVPPVIEPDEIAQLAPFLTYDQCKLRLVRLAIKCTERILTEKGNPKIHKVWGEVESGLELWTAAVKDLDDRLRRVEQSLAP